MLDPIMNMDNTETFTILNGGAATGTAIFQEVEGNELSLIDVSDFGGTLEMTISQIDSTNDDSTPGTPANDGLAPAFVYEAGTGIQTVTLTAVGTGPGVRTPTLNTDQDWIFDFTDAETTGTLAVPAGSTLTIDDSTVFQAGADLTLDDVQVYITGDVNLSQVDLDLDRDVGAGFGTSGTSSTKFHVAAGNSLTISVAQALALGDAGFQIVGEGTVKVVGDGSDGALNPLMNASDFGAALRTAVVDLSGVTLDLVGTAGTTADLDGELDIVLLGASNLADTQAIGQTAIGSNNNDDITMTSDGSFLLDYTFDGGLGNDTYRTVAGNPGRGDFTYLVEAGTDTIETLIGMDEATDGTSRDDVLIVSTGATANVVGVVDALGGPVPSDGFTARATTVNSGTANISESVLFPGALLYDFSDATGPNGYTITGNGNDTIVGSAFADTINGGNDITATGGAFDTLTGGDAGDTFVFNVDVSAGATFNRQVVTQGVDREEIDLAGIVDDDAGNESITIVYSRNNGSNVTVTVSDGNYGSDIDFSDATAVAAAVADMLDAGFVNTSTSGSLVTVSGQAGDSITLVSVTTLNLGTGPTSVAYGGVFYGDAIVTPDTTHVETLTVSGTPVDGDIYSLTTNFVGGGNTNGIYTVTGIETATDVANGLEAAFPDIGVTASDLGAVLTFTDQDADDGSFVAAVVTTEAFSGSGASSILNGDDEDYQSADRILDFDGVVDGDEISFDGLDAGDGSNYDEGAQVATYAAAYAAANLAFAGSAGSMLYYLTSAADLDGAVGTGLVNGQEGAGLLFVDANTDGQADLVVVLSNITEDTFSAGMIA